MSYMNQAEFAPAGGIQELSFDEIEQVDGGIVPLIVVAYYSIGTAATLLAAGTAFVAGARLGHAANKD